MLQCWAHKPADRPTFLALQDFLCEARPLTLTSTQAFDEADKLKIEVGDVIEVIEGRQEFYWWRGQNQRTFHIGIFPRLIADRQKPITVEDISKPLRNSFIHTGHGDISGNSWGNPAHIDEVYLQNPMEPPDLLGLKEDPLPTPKLRDRNAKSPEEQNGFKKKSSKQFGYNKLENEHNGDLKLQSSSKTKSKTKKEVTEGILIDFTNEISVSSPSLMMPSSFPTQKTPFMHVSSSLVDLTVPNSLSNLRCVDRGSSPEYDTFSTYSENSSHHDRYYNVPPSSVEASIDRYYSVVPSDNAMTKNTSSYYSPVAETDGNFLLTPAVANPNLTRMGSCPALHSDVNRSYNNIYQRQNSAHMSSDTNAFDDLFENFANVSFKQPAFVASKCQTATACDRNQMLEELKKTLGKKEMHSNFSTESSKKNNVKIPLLQPPQSHSRRNSRNYEQANNFAQKFPSDISTNVARLPGPPPVPSLPPNTAEIKPFVINNPVSSKTNNLSPSSAAFNFFPATQVSPNSQQLRKHLASMQARISGVTMDECQVAYQKHSGNIESAIQELQLLQLCRLGIAQRSHCEKVLKSTNWNLELAASALVDELQNFD